MILFLILPTTSSALKKSARRPKRKAEEGSVRRELSTDNAATWPRSDTLSRAAGRAVGRATGSANLARRADAIDGIPFVTALS